MSKIDDQLTAIEAGFTNPVTTYGTTWVADEQMEALKIRRKNASQTHHRLAYLSIGETGQAPVVTFYGHKFSDVLIQALKWRDLPTKSKRGPKKAQAAG